MPRASVTGAVRSATKARAKTETSFLLMRRLAQGKSCSITASSWAPSMREWGTGPERARGLAAREGCCLAFVRPAWADRKSNRSFIDASSSVRTRSISSAFSFSFSFSANRSRSFSRSRIRSRSRFRSRSRSTSRSAARLASSSRSCCRTASILASCRRKVLMTPRESLRSALRASTCCSAAVARAISILSCFCSSVSSGGFMPASLSFRSFSAACSFATVPLA
mmetsp:Transcript_14883/g.35020  ORF Transcript_14883/g.35020 Transcript_14883/m.35020 type:complete len:224 (+) Transcript_14883:280-951(+)